MHVSEIYIAIFITMGIIFSYCCHHDTSLREQDDIDGIECVTDKVLTGNTAWTITVWLLKILYSYGTVIRIL